jgi:GTP-binding protein LepA
VGFLGQLHFEITAGRLEREFGLSVLTSFPSIAYRVKTETGEIKIITQGDEWPQNVAQAWQPMIKLEIIAPPEYVNAVSQVGARYDMETLAFENIAESVLIEARMPLSELIRDFDDQLKSVTAGYASFTYEPDGEDVASLVKLEILLAGDVEPALTRIVPKKDAEREGRSMTEKLKELLPKLQFTQAIQARVDSKIIARETIAAMKKDVTGYLYGGDRSRKMKLWKKQQEGKKRLKSSGTVSVPISVFREILKK